jgi:hypothetical protein
MYGTALPPWQSRLLVAHPPSIGSYINSELKRWAEVVRAAKIKID